MRRSGDIPWGEYRLGLLILAGIGLFLWASIRGGSSLFERRESLRAHFRNVGGLTEGSPVWYRGLEVGSVSKIDILPAGDSSFVEVRFSVKPQAVRSMHADSRARISAINFFGEKFLDLTPGTVGAGAVAHGQLLDTEETPDFDALMQKSEGTLGNFDRLSRDLNLIAAKIRDGKGSLGLLINDPGLHDDLRRMSREMTSLARAMNESQGRASGALVSMAVQLDTLTARVNRGEGSLGLLARDPRLYTSLTGAASGADTTFSLVAGGKGSLGQLVNDKRAYEQITQTLERLNALLLDMQKNPKKYFKVSVF